ncbi:MAG: AAA family ATPase [Candidatus Gastranaerophilales bacterium]|nr:AAA family ATPase [Candidatus Gastranaerophilales bacterium]
MRKFEFVPAEKSQLKARVLISGAAGSGKTIAALELASALGSRVAVIDTENGSAALYSDKYKFEMLNLQPPYPPEDFVQAIKVAENSGFDVIVVDGITPEWSGSGGCLDLHTKLGGRFQDWAKITPRHRKFIQKILECSTHIICTCRSKQGYAMDEQSKKVTKMGMAPEQRDGLDYEMTLVFNIINQTHLAEATKDRTGLFDGKQFLISKNTGLEILEWLNSGTPAKSPAPTITDVRNLLISAGVKSIPDFKKVMMQVFGEEYSTLEELNQEQLLTLYEVMKNG